MDCIKCKSCEIYQSHEWRYQCIGCQCPNYYHTSYVTALETSESPSLNWVDHMNIESHNQLDDYHTVMSMASSYNLVWLPIGLQETEIPQFLDAWNTSCQSYSLELNDDNQMKRTRAILLQIPRNDVLNHSSSNSADEDELIERIKNAFKKNRDSNHLGFGEIEPVDLNEICSKCQVAFNESDKYCVRITHSGTFASHLACFKCETCEESLVDFHYCSITEKDQVYCLKHFGEDHYPRCASCNQLIFNKDYTKAIDKVFHENHFGCHNCDKTLTGELYTLKDDKPRCLTCYETFYGKTCDRCQKKISCGGKEILYNDRSWHDNCFYCDNCEESLLNKLFVIKENDIYCPDCFNEKYSPRCGGCGNIFLNGVKKFEHNGKDWHENCFLCSECNTSIGSKTFVLTNGKPICTHCYDEKYAKKCIKCSKIIREGGIMYKDNIMHKECFLCTHCKTQLTNCAVKEDKPYCSSCFDNLFSRRCKLCLQPISGFGGCEYYSYEDSQWHSDCFKCSKCNLNLIGKGFLAVKELLVCADCEKTTD